MLWYSDLHLVWIYASFGFVAKVKPWLSELVFCYTVLSSIFLQLIIALNLLSQLEDIIAVCCSKIVAGCKVFCEWWNSDESGVASWHGSSNQVPWRAWLAWCVEQAAGRGFWPANWYVLLATHFLFMADGSLWLWPVFVNFFQTKLVTWWGMCDNKCACPSVCQSLSGQWCIVSNGVFWSKS